MIQLVLPLVILFAAGFSHAADRDTALALLAGVDALIEQGNAEKALKFCDRALAADKACPAVHMKMGECCRKLGDAERAIACFQEAERLAKAEQDYSMARNAQAAINAVCPGLPYLQRADAALLKKLVALADSALEEGNLDTADEVYKLILARWPDHANARSGSKRTGEALARRGDPVKRKIAEAMLNEVWYLVGIGDKAEARTMARALSAKYFRLPAGQEAEKLLASDFRAPKKEDAAALKQKLIARHKERTKAASSRLAGPGPSDPGAAASRRPPSVDIEAAEKSANAKAVKLAKSGLATAFNAAFERGIAHYRKAQPGTEGNQQNLALALEQFVQCESIYMRMESAGLKSPEAEQRRQKASMLRYACMKMTVLRH